MLATMCKRLGSAMEYCILTMKCEVSAIKIKTLVKKQILVYEVVFVRKQLKNP